MSTLPRGINKTLPDSSPPCIYRYLAPWYEPISPWWLNHFYRDAYTAFDYELQQRFPPGGSALDLGCGTGSLLDRLLRLELPVETYVGIDISPDMLKKARSKYPSDTRVSFQHMDINSETLPDQCFDLVVSSWAFEHFLDPLLIVEKAWKHLNPGGSMLFLFEVDSTSLRSRLTGALWKLFKARLLPPDLPHRFPGFVDMRTFNGPLGILALVILEKVPG